MSFRELRDQALDIPYFSSLEAYSDFCEKYLTLMCREREDTKPGRAGDFYIQAF